MEVIKKECLISYIGRSSFVFLKIKFICRGSRCLPNLAIVDWQSSLLTGAVGPQEFSLSLHMHNNKADLYGGRHCYFLDNHARFTGV